MYSLERRTTTQTIAEQYVVESNLSTVLPILSQIRPKLKTTLNHTSFDKRATLAKECPHQTFSLMRSGPDVSAYCAKCWKLIFKSKEVMAWKYAVETSFREEPKGCTGKLVKMYRTDRFVTARCMTCDFHVRKSEFKVDRSAIVQPRLPPVKSVWKITSSV